MIGIVSVLLAVYFALCACAAGSAARPYDTVVFVLVALTMGASSFLLIAKGSSKLSKAVVCLNVCAWIFLSVTGVPAFVRVRKTSATNPCLNNLRQIEGAKQQWALENGVSTNAYPSWKDIGPYIGSGTNVILRCPDGGTYTLGRVDEPPRCSTGLPWHKLL